MALKLEIVPQKAVVVRREKTIVAASWFGPGVPRPYVYPFLAPGDREVTRLGHPEDPVGHSHHRSIWIGHHDVAGVSFWEDAPGAGRIEQTEASIQVAEGNEVKVALSCAWKTAAEKTLLLERRTLAFSELGGGELALEIDSELRPAGDDAVVLGDTPFGLLGVRVARTMRVAEGLGGRILNSSEAENEAGCMGQHAEWCDYSGPVPLAAAPGKKPAPGMLPAATAGVSVFEHPENTPGDTLWHVRDDGWMGPCISKGEPRTIPKGGFIRVRFRIEAHAGTPGQAHVDERYRVWRRRK